MSQKNGKGAVRTWAKRCEECGKRYRSKAKRGRFCSDLCRVKNWQRRHPRIDPQTGEIKQAV